MRDRKLEIILLAAAVGAGAGCQREEISVYTVPKEQRVQMAETPHAGHDHEVPARKLPRPKLTWTLPAGWQEVAPGQVNLAAFKIAAEGDKEAQVTVAALPLMAGREADIVNLWRGQLGLSQLAPEQARAQLSELPINGAQAKLLELSGSDPAKPDKIVTVMIHHPDASWFYKLQGDGAPVDAQRAAFIEFIKSVREAGPSVSASETPGAPPTSGAFTRVAPEGWKPLPAGRMQVAKFTVPPVQGATGLVSVSMFDNDTGGTLANVNRWRGQLGLPNATPTELPQLTQPLDTKVPGAVLVNLTNGGQQLLGAIVPRGGDWFFYKLVGNVPAVAPQKDAFIRFAASEL